MEIFFIYLKSFSQTGGIESFNKKFIKALDEINYKNKKVNVVSIYEVKSDFKYFSDNIKFHGFNGNFLNAILFLIKNINKKSLIFYGHVNILPFTILLHLFKINKNAFFIIHGIDAWKKFSFYKRYFLKKYKFLAVSNYTKNIFLSKNNISRRRIYLFPNCIDLNIQNNLNPYKKSNFNILSVSRLNADEGYKGIDSLIKAISLIVKKIPSLKLTVIGKGDDKIRLENLAKEYNICDNVDFKGYVKSIDSYYEYCDLFALPSKGEGFGIVYLEAMKYSKPVIAANAGGATDVIKDGVTGLLCEYDDIICLSKQIQNVYLNRTKYIKLGKDGNTYMKENFTYQIYKQRLHEIIKNFDEYEQFRR